jgi:hypothetical protein
MSARMLPPSDSAPVVTNSVSIDQNGLAQTEDRQPCPLCVSWHSDSGHSWRSFDGDGTGKGWPSLSRTAQRGGGGNGARSAR